MRPEIRILWRRLDRPGHEYAALRRDESAWLLSGISLFEHEAQPCRLEYDVTCDQDWSTICATVSGWVGERNVDVRIKAHADGSWEINNEPCISVGGCKDIDFSFSPSTNLLPIRRLNLHVGQESRVRAAWLRFPDFTLEPLEQTYHRISDSTFRYESASGKFVAELHVSKSGLPLRYGDLWCAEAAV